MHIQTITVPVLQANCYLITQGDDVLVVDPGAGGREQIEAAIADRTLVGVAVTHGHLDHVFDAGRLANSRGVPVYVGAADEDRLSDLDALEGALLSPILRSAGVDPESYQAPRDIVGMADGPATLGALTLTWRCAPGHTPGASVLEFPGAPDEASTLPRMLATPGAPTALTGDVLFAGSIGRMDFPGGDEKAMVASLRTLLAALPPSATILPGHGPGTTMATERARNPFLRAYGLV